MRKALYIFCGLSAIFGFASEPNLDPKLEMIKDYRNWTRATEHVQDMSARMSVLCAPAPPASSVSPSVHAAKVYLVYVNKTGKSAMMKAGKAVFPDGSVIVKEKYARPENPSGDRTPVESLTKLRPELLTVMYKNNGKWLYFSVDSGDKVHDRDVSHCRSCHERNKSNDRVFRSYVAGAPRPSGY